MEKTKADEAAEKARLAELKETNFTGFISELRKYVDQINATGPPPLLADTELRDCVLRSSCPPSRLLDDIYNYTFRAIPYEDAMYICAPEQAVLLHLLTKAMLAVECLDVGTFTGYSASAIAQALPSSARITAIELKPEYAHVAREFLAETPPTVDVREGDALDVLAQLKEEGRSFDFISIDSDKQQQQNYYEACLELLRPRGMLVMFGMMLYPTEEDKDAIDSLISLVANDTRVTTTMLPIGCGVQICSKNANSTDYLAQLPATHREEERRRYLLEAELSALDAAIADTERARDAAGQHVPRVPEALRDYVPVATHEAGGAGAVEDVRSSGGEGTTPAEASAHEDDDAVPEARENQRDEVAAAE